MLDFSSPEMEFMRSVLSDTACLARVIQAEASALNLTKSDCSPVTVADFAIQAIVAHRLKALFPDTLLVAEERASRLREPEQVEMLQVIVGYVGRLVPGASSKSVCDWIDEGSGEPGQRFWTLDPIDGTKGYRRGGHYAVALALIDEGRVAVGGMACPSLVADCSTERMGNGVLVLAARGGGAWSAPLDRPEAPFSRLSVSSCADSSKARLMRSFESGHTNVDNLEILAGNMGIFKDNCVLMDSQAKYAALASGKAELLFRLLSPSLPGYRECIWDQAAGSIVVEEAGGSVTDLKGFALDFSRGRRLENNTGVFASNGLLHEAGLAALAALNNL